MRGTTVYGRLLLAATAAMLQSFSLAHAQSPDVPKHLAIARELVDNIKPENNHYVRGGRFISLPGDKSSGGYAMKADCSGFLLAMFERAHYPTQSAMGFLSEAKKRKRPAAEDFVYSIEKEEGFKRIRRVADIKPGDLIAHAMLNAEDRKETGTTGHVFLVNSAPKQIASWNPVVEGTTQYEVSMIDSNNEHLGADDSRLANRVQGLGKGTIRIYADAKGELVGWARTFKFSKFFSYDARFPSYTKARKATIGRPLAAAS